MGWTNWEILKYVILIGSAPIWLPFVKILWEELNDALREEGGILGADPGPVRRAEIRAEMDAEEGRVVHETIAHRRTRLAGKGPAASDAPGPRPTRSRKSGPTRHPFR